MAISDEDRERITQTIRSYLARERISREEFAQRAKIGKSTVDKLVTGMFSEKTVLQIDQQLGLGLLSTLPLVELAPEEFGRYSREETTPYIGHYVLARPSFSERGVIQAFHMEIAWQKETRTLVIKEAAQDKKIPLQFGSIYIPRGSMHIFVMSNENGWLKSVILSQIDVYKCMKGIILTMGHAFANVYTPLASPVILSKYPKIEPSMVGALKPSSPHYHTYFNALREVETERFAQWVTLGKDGAQRS
ncbi:MAG: hypothetical protein NW223_10470 [Hyphomicrobiaceae bacterium]|nr:hypothetical protein [Hyphomicrobiaceae bacterium]